MAITQCIPTQAKQDLLDGVHLAANTYKMALFVVAATLDATSATYSSTNEVANGSGYTTGGVTMSGRTSSTTGTTGYVDWTADPQWTSASFTARGAVIYNSSVSNKILAILDFGSDYTCTNGTFTVTLPAAGATAIVRIS